MSRHFGHFFAGERPRLLPVFLIAAAVAWLAGPAFAGIYYEAVTSGSDDSGRAMPEMVVEAWVEGAGAKVLFKESSNNPMAPAGSYILTRDGGETLFLVNPEEKTYAEWDLDAMLRMAGSLMEGMGGVFNLEFSEPRVEKLLEEDGGALLGLPTRHYRYRTSYSMQLKMLGMKRANDVVMEQDLWLTGALQEAALGVWLRKDPPKTGNEQLDKLISSEITKIEGFPLKTETVTRTTGGKKGNKESVSRSSTTVRQLDRGRDIPPSTFEIPQGYTKTEMMVPAAGGEGSQGGGEMENPFKKIFGRGKG